MPQYAIDRRTGAYHHATELAFNENLQNINWKCLGCEVDMYEVAADGEEDYERPPHFRLPRGVKHHEECEGPDFGNIGQGARRNALGIPDRLVLQGPRLLQAAANHVAGVAADEPRNEPQQQNGVNDGGVIVGAINPIVQYYRQRHSNLDRRIRILDWPENSYRYSFKKLLGQIDVARLQQHRIFYSPIFFTGITYNDNEITVPLLAYSGGHRLEVRFPLRDLTARQAQNTANTIRASQARQRDLHINQSSTHVVLYFIGDRDVQQPHVFKLTDPRLSCFLSEVG